MNWGLSSVCTVLFCRLTDLTVVLQLSLPLLPRKDACCLQPSVLEGIIEMVTRYMVCWLASRERALLNMSKDTLLFAAFYVRVSWYLHRNVSFGCLRNWSVWDTRRVISEDKQQGPFTGHRLYNWPNSWKASCAVNRITRKVIRCRDSWPPRLTRRWRTIRPSVGHVIVYWTH